MSDDYAARAALVMSTAELGDTLFTVDGVNWHCIWCGEPTPAGGTCCVCGMCGSNNPERCDCNHRSSE